MAVVRWLGGGVAVAQVVNVTPAGTIESGDLFRAQISNKVLTYASTATTIASVVTGFTSAWNASTEPEFAEVTAVASGTTSITLTADVAGKPFTVSTTTVEADGSTSDSQTFTTTTAGTTSAGPNHFNTAANFDINAIPATSDDLYIENGSVDILYGLNSSGVTLANYHQAQNYTGKIGLPERNAGGYPEYRTTSLNISAVNARIGYGTGAGSGRTKINFGTAQTAITILNSGTPIENGVESILLTANNSSNTIHVLKGSVGVGIVTNTTSNFSGGANIAYISQQASDSKVRFGPGVALATVNVRGGVVELNSNATTIIQTGGELSLNLAMTVTALHLEGGTCFDKSSGTMTTLHVSRGVMDYRQHTVAKTCTTVNLYAGAKLLDPYRRVAFGSSVINLLHCGIEDVTVDYGKNIQLGRINLG